MELTQDQAEKQIQAIIDEVANTWLANDGGLTMAASDVISFGRSLLKNIRAQRRATIIDMAQFWWNPVEQIMVEIATQWAK